MQAETVRLRNKGCSTSLKTNTHALYIDETYFHSLLPLTRSLSIICLGYAEHIPDYTHVNNLSADRSNIYIPVHGYNKYDSVLLTDTSQGNACMHNRKVQYAGSWTIAPASVISDFKRIIYIFTFYVCAKGEAQVLGLSQGTPKYLNCILFLSIISLAYDALISSVLCPVYTSILAFTTLRPPPPDHLIIILKSLSLSGILISKFDNRCGEGSIC